jgi:hypothetical protein
MSIFNKLFFSISAAPNVEKASWCHDVPNKQFQEKKLFKKFPK